MRRINSRISSFPALVVLLGALLLVATFLSAPGHMSAATPRPASSPAVQIAPNSGPYGTETVVTGQGFALMSRWQSTKGRARSSPTTPMQPAVLSEPGIPCSGQGRSQGLSRSRQPAERPDSRPLVPLP